SPGAVEFFAPLISQIGSLPVAAEDVQTNVRQFLEAMMRMGYTGVVDAGGPQPEAVAAAAAEVGMRAMVAPHIADVWPNEVGELPVSQADPAELLEQAAAFIDANDGLGDGLVRAGVSGVWTMTCSDELLAGIAELAITRDIPVHIHTNVLDEEAGVHANWFGGRTAIERLDEAGLLNERVTLMHAGALSDEDIELIAASGATVNHNPLGNAMLGFGVANQLAVPRMLAAGIPLVLGSDTAPNKLASPFESMIAAMAISREVAGDDFAFTVEDALRAATNGGVSLGRPGLLGAIEPGQLADLVLIRPDPPYLAGPAHPVPTVVLNGHAGQVDSVIINGRHLVPGDRQSALRKSRSP
ncbi:MAG: amidohydrolase family protein, partial [Myxococcota bacterium]